MKFLDNYLKKRIKELDEHPELNKNRKNSKIYIIYNNDLFFYLFMYFQSIIYAKN